MTREELELLAKWCGYTVHGSIGERFYVMDLRPESNYFDPFPWNPETNDTDFLNMVAGRVDFEFTTHRAIASTSTNYDFTEQAKYTAHNNNRRAEAMKHAAIQVCLMAARGTKPSSKPPMEQDAVADDWQPIETAPKDRMLLLGFYNSMGNWRTVKGRYFTQETIEMEWECGNDLPEGWYEVSTISDEIPNCWYFEPTRWTPLPAAPSSQQVKKEGECEG